MFTCNAISHAQVTGRHTPPPVATATDAALEASLAARSLAESGRYEPGSRAELWHRYGGDHLRVGYGQDGQDDVDWLGAGPAWSYHVRFGLAHARLR
jgi:hypothetical protein